MLTIDVIIPVYRPTTKLRKVLQGIREQSYLAQKIILLHTEDGKALKQYMPRNFQTPVEEIMIRTEEFDHGKTRDLGMGSSCADVVICMTQDAVPANQYVFEHLVKALESDQKIAVSYARQIPDGNCGAVEAYTRKFNYPENSRVKTAEDLNTLGIKTYFCSNVCAAYRKNTYEELGGFEKNIIFNEDMVYAANAIHHGYKVAYSAEAVVIHSHHYSGKQQMKRNFDLGVSQACYPEVFEYVSSESEGIKLVKDTAVYLLNIKKPYALIELFVQSFSKYLGYKLGKNHNKLPDWIILKLSMNRGYWGNRRETYEKER